MTRFLPVIFLSTLLLAGAAFAQSFEPPSIPDFSDFPGVGIPQIDPPSLEISVGPSDVDLANLGEAIGEAIDGAWEGQPAGGPGDAFNPDFFNPDIFDETDPGVALLELLGLLEEAVRKGMTKTDLIEGLVTEPIEATRPKVKEIVVVGSKVEEAVRRGLQQGRLILDSDAGAIEEALRRGLQQGRLILDSDVGAIEEALRRGLQQGRLILDSDSNETSNLPNPPLRGETAEDVGK